jgi:cytochrome c peroxidase
MSFKGISVSGRIVVTGTLILGAAIGVRGSGASNDSPTSTPASTSSTTTTSARALSRPFLAQYTRPADVPFPKDNAYTPARETLGRTLFFDPRLSGSNWISCASCHNPGFAWGDGLPRAIGHGMQVLGRRTPTILNLAWADAVFWDGRADSLEAQALGPIQAPGEMNQSVDDLAKKLGAIDGYRPLFAAAYPGEPIAPQTVAKAIATFERGVVSTPAPFDLWVMGDDTAMSDDAQKGFVLFNTTARCAKCHSGWRFTNDSFHDIGVPGHDTGRGALLKEIDVMQHAFKTPTLRDVNRRGPYMHDGSVATLDAVVDFYDRGGAAARESLSKDLKPLGLTAAEKRQLLAFMGTLTSPGRSVQMPSLPR